MTLKEIASDFLRLASSVNVRDAYAKHAAPDFRHHNAYFPGDAQSLMLAMEENAKKNPGKSLKIVHALQDGNLVALHSHVTHNAEERGYALMHLFRFEGEKIAELWDIAQEIPKESPNEHGMF